MNVLQRIIWFVIPSTSFCWYSRLAPAALQARLFQSATSSEDIGTLCFGFRAPAPLYQATVNNGDFRLEVQSRAPKGHLILTGHIVPHADGSLLQGRIGPGPFTVAVAGILAVMFAPMLLEIIQSVSSHSLDSHKLRGLSIYILFAVGAPRLDFFISRQALVDSIQRRFLARDISLPTAGDSPNAPN